MKPRKNITIILIVFGIVLIFSALRSVYYAYQTDRSYELKGWKTVTATCTQEKPYTRTSTR